jgi:hypothetical protein
VPVCPMAAMNPAPTASTASPVFSFFHTNCMLESRALGCCDSGTIVRMDFFAPVLTPRRAYHGVEVSHIQFCIWWVAPGHKSHSEAGGLQSRFLRPRCTGGRSRRRVRAGHQRTAECAKRCSPWLCASVADVERALEARVEGISLALVYRRWRPCTSGAPVPTLGTRPRWRRLRWGSG